MFLFLGVPLAMNYFGFAKTTEMTLQATHVLALALVVILPATILPALFFAPSGVDQATATSMSLRSALKSLRANGPMQIFLGALLISELGYGIFATLIFLYIDDYLGIGAKFSVLIMAINIATLASLPVWLRLSRSMGKRAAVILSWTVQSVAFFGLAFIPRGEAGFVPLMVVIAVSSFFSGAGLSISPSILGDIVDYDTLKTGGYRAGSYFALYSLADKIVVAVGTGLAFLLLGLGGYDAAHPKANTEHANWTMLAVFAVLPAVLRLASLAVLWRYPLNARRQGIIRKRLEQREARARRAEFDGAVA